MIGDIRNLGINNFDYIVGTNTQEDYIGGMAAVITEFNTKIVLLPDSADPSETYTGIIDASASKHVPVYHPRAEDYFYMGQITFAIQAPASQTTHIHNYSTVIKAVYGESSFFFASDIQINIWEKIRSEGYNVGADVLKVGDHGSSSSISDKMLENIQAKYAVIEVGRGNPDGDPSPTALDELDAAGVKTYRTDLNGTVKISYDGISLQALPAH